MNTRVVALYFVASPLQYLAARQIAQRHEAGARQVLVWYKKGLASIVQAGDWDDCVYMPWPRWDPLPGPMGRHRRLRTNIRTVAELIGPCDVLHIHSAVFDTEAINYFLRALPRRCGARAMAARILPDGVISIRRYPLSLSKRGIQYTRKLRRLLAPELDYWCFSGDRIGSDAPFCDRIYVLPGLPHEYPPAKTVTLAPLVAARELQDGGHSSRRALVIGQPMVGAGLMAAADRDAVSAEIRQWLQAQGFDEVHYKGHPKDPNQELCAADYQVLQLTEPVELWMSRQSYQAVVGTRSTALLFAAQLYGADTAVCAFGWDRTRFKSRAEARDMARAFTQAGVRLMHPPALD
ncbi:polysialyltransferase family glycosyltransferase [Aquabacterium fontiphilum]|uniref:polysialyltransferase family glycosyltransferase n=1 Tax=Aquabacterium fontiphilum TaxID=450365 RepID=UPI002ED1EA9A